MGAHKSLATEADYASVLRTANTFKAEADQLRTLNAEMLEALKVDEIIQTRGYTQEALKDLQAAGIDFPPECWSSSQAINRFQKEKRSAAIAKAEGR